MPRGIVAGEIHRRLAHLLAPIDRHGAPGEFAATETAAEVLERVRKELGDAAADALATALQP
jgi:hypothetical protein